MGQGAYGSTAKEINNHKQGRDASAATQRKDGVVGSVKSNGATPKLKR